MGKAAEACMNLQCIYAKNELSEAEFFGDFVDVDELVLNEVGTNTGRRAGTVQADLPRRLSFKRYARHDFHRVFGRC